jgi:mannose-6-phosphate isomerase-like protein (cupin superfamily)
MRDTQCPITFLSDKFPAWINWAAVIMISCVFLACSSSEDMTKAPPIEMTNQNDDAKEILQRYAKAWRGNKEMTLRSEIIAAFWVEGDGGGQYHIKIPVEGVALLDEEVPEQYTFGFETDMETLRRLDRGEWNALTAMGQARGSDPIPLMPKMPPGFTWTTENAGYFIPLFFHFWNREWPETVRFGEGTSRQVHGANTTVFFYDSGLRSAWYQIKPGMHINADPEDQANEFHTFAIITRGRVNSRLDGELRVLREGEAVFIPAGITHEFWADTDQYGELVLLMFGHGA